MVMTPEEFRDKMEKIQDPDKNGDCEAEHIDADNLMCEVLRGLGYTEGVDVFMEMTLWYA